MKLVWSTPEIDQFSDQEFEKLLKHLRSNGFDGIEPMYYSRPNFEIHHLKDLLDANGQKVVGLRTGGIAAKYEVSFSSPDQTIREKAVNHFIEAIHYAEDLETPLLLVGLLQGRLSSEQNYQDARKNIIDCLVRCAETAAKSNITIGLEAINRFTLGYHSKAEQIIELLREMNAPNIRLLLDTFHMNIEESCLEETLILSAPWLGHVHLADNNRLAPGRGNLDFVRIIKILKALDYQGYISIESDDYDWFPAISDVSRLLLPLIK